jgi:hypothetical protein
MSLPEIPFGLTIGLLAPDDRTLAEDCRHFCLRAIKDTYGYNYTPEWHADLDSLGKAALATTPLPTEGLSS